MILAFSSTSVKLNNYLLCNIIVRNIRVTNAQVRVKLRPLSNRKDKGDVCACVKGI